MGQGQLLIADLPLALDQDGNPAGQLVGWRFGDYRPKDQLDLWLEHLFVCALLADLPDNQKHSRFLCTKRIKPYSYLPLPADEACAELRTLLQLYRRGQTSLLPFLPDTSFEYAKAVNKGKAQSATRVWNDHSGGDIARDPAWRLLLGPLQSPLLPADFFGPSDGTLESPMPAGFDELATQVFGPMLANADKASNRKSQMSEGDTLYRNLARPGIHLVEANAGSGKTYSLVSLCLRLLAAGQVEASGLLLVTFTRTATAQLRQATETMLRELLQQWKQSESDTLKAHPWIAEAGEPAKVRSRLKRALELLDEALICTIDSFCRHILVDYALELGLPRKPPPPSADTACLQTACLDWWRSEVRQKNGSIAVLAGSRLKGDSYITDPDSLAKALSVWRRHCGGPLRFDTQDEATSSLQDCLQRADEEIRRRERLYLTLGANPSFTDLLDLLADKLAADDPPVRQMRRQVRQRWRAVLVDESQDNNRTQFEVFLRLFGPDEGRDPRHLLLFIGDPKQAIYSFRGGDLQAWFDTQARPEVTHHPLPADNWRSNEKQVQAVNRLFACSPFFAPNDPNADSMRYRPSRVAAGARPLSLLLEGQNSDGLLVRTCAASTEQVRQQERQVAEACADDIAKLLQLAKMDRAVLSGEGCEPRPVEAGDLAVLTRSNDQAVLVGDALRARGVHSLLRNDRKVFDTPEAFWLLTLLRALAQPQHRGLLAAALATPLIGRVPDEVELADWAGRFANWRAIWLTRGCYPALLTLMAQTGMSHRLLEQTAGQRSLTNLLHLVELLSQQNIRNGRPEALTRYMEATMESENQGEEHEIRLETDENLVWISTVHRAKGLEYPLVFLPFTWKGPKAPKRPPTDKASFAPLPGRNRERERCLIADTTQLQHWRQDSEREQTDEEMRLLYVAMTRAACHTRQYWPEQAELPFSIQRLLDAEQAAANEDMEPIADLWAHLADDDGIAISPVGEATSRSEGAAFARDTGRARTFAPASGRVQQNLQITNYTSISALLSDPGQLEADDGQLTEQPDHDQMLAEEDDPAPDTRSIATLPKGRHTGIFFHEALEYMVQHQLLGADAETLAGTCRDLLVRAGPDNALADWGDIAGQALENTARARLPGTGFCLADLAAGSGQVLSELEFEFPLRDGWHAVLPPTGSALRPGFMKGFIDLVLAGDGRYYLADLKTNWLGPDAASYGPEQLSRAAAHHHYDLQLKLYGLALHRHLRSRLADYDYDRHFGGSFLMFLRGLKAGDERGIWSQRLSSEQMQQLDQDIG